MHGVANTFHAFLRLNDESSLAFVQNPDIAKIPSEIGLTHAGNAGANSAPGTMQHLALKVANNDELLAMRDRLRSKGVPVLGPIEHGMCCSIYFAGLENMTLELSYSNEPINNEAWIDPEVVDLLNINAEELAGFKRSSNYQDEKGSVPQPGPDASGPHMNYPKAGYQGTLATPDEVFLNSVPNEPPVALN